MTTADLGKAFDTFKEKILKEHRELTAAKDSAENWSCDCTCELEQFTNDQITDYLSDEGFFCIKLHSLPLRDKLKTFIETELLPDYNDHKNIAHL